MPAGQCGYVTRGKEQFPIQQVISTYAFLGKKRQEKPRATGFFFYSMRLLMVILWNYSRELEICFYCDQTSILLVHFGNSCFYNIPHFGLFLNFKPIPPFNAPEIKSV